MAIQRGLQKKLSLVDFLSGLWGEPYLLEEQDRLRAIKLHQLRQDIREGLTSGEPTPWSLDEIKKEGRKRRAARSAGKPEA